MFTIMLSLEASLQAPKRVVFVDTLPKSPSGQPLKREWLQEQAGRIGST